MKNTESRSNALIIMSFVAFIIIAVLEIIAGLKAMGVDIFNETIGVNSYNENNANIFYGI